MPDTDIPKMQVYVATLKPWEAVLLVPTDGDEPVVATMDRREDEFEIAVSSRDIRIKGGGEHEIHETEARSVRCPGCASANLGWQTSRVDIVYLQCRDCDERVIEADLNDLLEMIGSDVIYEGGFDWKVL